MWQLRRASRRESLSWPELARWEEGGVLAPPLALDGFRSSLTLPFDCKRLHSLAILVYF